MNNNNKIYEKDPNNLKYTLYINNTNDSCDTKDKFEVIKDNKKYITPKNNNNYNLNAFKLLTLKILILEIILEILKQEWVIQIFI